MRKSAELFLVFLNASYTLAQVAKPGPCPSIKPVDNFNMTAYSGTWYEMERLFFFPEISGKCISVHYTEMIDGNCFTVIQFTDTISKYKMAFPGKTILIDPLSSTNTNVTGNMQLTLTLLNPLFPEKGVLKTINYKIAATDYVSYTIKWACVSLVGVHFRSMWILTRDPNYPQEAWRAIREHLRSLSIDDDLLIRTDNNNCDQVDDPLFG